MRKMASVQIIDDIKNIENADLICAYRVGGWWVVDSKGRYKIGDKVIYCEIDSWIPNEVAPFLSKGKEPRMYNGILGERLRTVKLRGQISQGLLLDIQLLKDVVLNPQNRPRVAVIFEIGDDVSQWLSIQKWEAPIFASGVGGIPRGNFPHFIPKTDQERIQNLRKDFQQFQKDKLTFTFTEKLDGSSMTVYRKDDYIGVCSRNIDLKEDDSKFWTVAKKEGLLEELSRIGRNLAFQGELIGEGIQGNPYKLKGNTFYLFDVFDIDEQRYLTTIEIDQLVSSNIKRVPVIKEGNLEDYTIDSLLEEAEFKSKLNNTTEAEGYVLKCLTNADISFKVISNKFLLKKG